MGTEERTILTILEIRKVLQTRAIQRSKRLPRSCHLSSHFDKCSVLQEQRCNSRRELLRCYYDLRIRSSKIDIHNKSSSELPTWGAIEHISRPLIPHASHQQLPRVALPGLPSRHFARLNSSPGTSRVVARSSRVKGQWRLSSGSLTSGEDEPAQEQGKGTDDGRSVCSCDAKDAW